MLRFAHVVLVFILLLLAACTQPTTQRQAPPQAFPGNPLEQPVKPRPIGGGPAAVDTSCRTDADCTVKNVGNCCGYYPACVNVNAKVDPQAVADECRRTGRVGVCGFPDISACRCVSGQCTGDNRLSTQ
ncbi:hypothetical protein [Luteimonas sp. e5]